MTSPFQKLLNGVFRFLFAILALLAVRWALFEPYVIPSGSMIPTLLIHDHIMVNKLAYGIRLPFTSQWLMHFASPQRGEVVIFRSVEDDNFFMVKRVVGLAGDHMVFTEDGQLMVNGKPDPGPKSSWGMTPGEEWTVPAGHIFVMGDNRDNSRDSRSWGPLPLSHLLGRAMFVWLSCEETLPEAPYLCDPSTLRWARFFHRIN